jgi:hypothetical protein
VPILPPLGGFCAIFDFRDFHTCIFWTTSSNKGWKRKSTPNEGERPGNVLGATRHPKWSQDVLRPDFHKFPNDYRRMLLVFGLFFIDVRWILDKVEKGVRFDFIVFRVPRISLTSSLSHPQASAQRNARKRLDDHSIIQPTQRYAKHIHNLTGRRHRP